MKKIIYILFLFLIFLITFVNAVPKIEPYVNDFANLLTPDQETQLNIQCDIIEKNTSYEIAIVTVQNTEGDDRVLYANKIGDENGVGKKGKDNGIIVLWSIEDGGAIATGRYSESILNDAKVARIGREARPLFDKGQYYEAFTQIVNEINKEIITSKDGSVNATSSSLSGSSGNDDGKIFILILIIGLGVWIILKVFNATDIFTGIAIGSILGGIGKSGGGVKVGGGRSFGSGSFGGGGAKF